MDERRLDGLLDRLQALEHDGSVLRRICLVTVDVTSMAGSGVSRILDHRHEALEATNAISANMEALQAEMAEGPCRQAVMTGKACFAPDMTSAQARQRWPRFARVAAEQGVLATFAFPLLSNRGAIGALDIYATEACELEHERLADVWLLASLAALAVDQGETQTSITGVDLASEPAEEWAYPAVVHNAAGMVSEQLEISVAEALLRLRALAFATGRRVRDVARDVVDRTLRIERWADDD